MFWKSTILRVAVVMGALALPAGAAPFTPADVTPVVTPGVTGFDYHITFDLNQDGDINRLLIPLLADPATTVFDFTMRLNGNVIGTVTPVTGAVGIADYAWSYTGGSYARDAEFITPPWILVLDFGTNVLDNDLFEIDFTSPYGPTDAPYQAITVFSENSYSYRFIDPPIPGVPEPTTGLALVLCSLTAVSRRRRS